MGLEQGKAQANHAGAIFPVLQQRPTFGTIERKVAQDREPIRMLARGPDSDLITIWIPTRRMQDRGIDAGFGHLLQQAVFGEDLDLAVVRVGRRPTAPDVDLGVDDSHVVYSGEVPIQPVSETSTITPSGPLYFTSTLPPCRGPWPTPSAWFTSSRGFEPAASSFWAISSRLSTWKPIWWMPLHCLPRSAPATASLLKLRIARLRLPSLR